MAYNSKHTGEAIDAAVDKVSTIGDVSALETSDKSSVVAAVNENTRKLNAKPDSYAIVIYNEDAQVLADGEVVDVPAYTTTRIYARKSLDLYYSTPNGGSSSLSYLNVSHLDVSEFTTLTFGSSSKSADKVRSLNVSNLNVSRVKRFNSLFGRLWKLCELQGLDTWDTSNVTSLYDALSSIKISNMEDVMGWNVEEVTNAQWCFSGNMSNSFDLRGWKLMKCKDTGYMFSGCLADINLMGFDLESCESVSFMFRDCASVTDLHLGPGFFKMKCSSIDFSSMTGWTNSTMIASLVTRSYDRAANGLGVLTVQLSAQTKVALGDENIAKMSAKGYTIA